MFESVVEGAQRGAEVLDQLAKQRLVVLDLESFLAEPIPPRKALLDPIVLEQSLIMVHSWRGIGKTHVALGAGYAVASGSSFLRWQAREPRKVVFLDGEMPAVELQERLARIVASGEKEPPPGFFRLVTPDRQAAGMPDLGTRRGQQIVDEAIEPDTALIIVDNLSSLVRHCGSENEGESWLLVSEWALRHRAHGRSVIFVHHSGKSRTQRGTSRREDALDVVLVLRHPPDYDPKQGALFEVHFEKARHLRGDAVKPFEARLTVDANGSQTWAVRELEESTIDRVIELHELGLSQGEMATELHVHKSTISRAFNRAKEQGSIVTDGDTK